MAMSVRFVVIVVASLWITGCNIAGGISEQSEIEWLSKFTTEQEAKAIVMHKKCDPDRLVELIDILYVWQEERLLIMTHPNFPVSKRIELLRNGKGDLFICNGNGTEEEVLAYLEGHDGYGIFQPVGIDNILNRTGLSRTVYDKARAVRRKKLEGIGMRLFLEKE